MSHKQTLTLIDPASDTRAAPLLHYNSILDRSWIITEQPGGTGPYFVAGVYNSLRAAKKHLAAVETANAAVIILDAQGELFLWQEL